MAKANVDYRAHLATYTSFNKLVLFTILWIVLILSCMALGLVGRLPVIAIMGGFGGTLALALIAGGFKGLSRSEVDPRT